MRNAKSKDSFKISDFEFGDVIGEGGFGVVYQALWKEKKEQIAIKKVSSKQRSERLRLEVENHQRTEHENIVKFYGHFKEDDVDYIVMELCKEGSLRNHIKSHGIFSPEQAVSVMFQLVIALEYLHSKNIAHRDLTAGNVLIKRVRANGNFCIKICDFGLAKVMNGGRAAHTMAGTPGYMDPHVANHDKYGKEVDVYSLGCVLYVMLTGHEPSGRAQFPRLSELEENAAHLIARLTDSDPKRRIRLEEIKHSAFMMDTSTGRETTSRSRSRDIPFPSSIHGRRSSIDHKSVERRTINSMDQLSVRERSRSRGAPLRERNRSPPGTTTSRNIHSSRSSSQVRVQPIEGINMMWPINIDRLTGKKEDWNGHRLEIVSAIEAVLTRDGREIMRIQVQGNRQRVGIPNCARGHMTPCFDCIHSLEELPKSLLTGYNTILSMLEKIRWKVAKVIFNNASICPGGIIRLMENGDLRMKDAQGRVFSVAAKSRRVYEGDPAKPTKIVTDATRIKEILAFREFCHDTEASLERLGIPFPFVSYIPTEDTRTVKRTTREAMLDSTRPLSVNAGSTDLLNSSNRLSSERVSRAKSSCSHLRRPMPDSTTVISAPAVSNCDKENRGGRMVCLKTKNGEIRGIRDETNGISLRISTVTRDQYIYTDAKGKEDRFTFTGDYSSLPVNQYNLMKRLHDSRNQR